MKNAFNDQHGTDQALTWLGASPKGFDRLQQQATAECHDAVTKPASTLRRAIFFPAIAHLFTTVAFVATSTQLGRVLWLVITFCLSLTALHCMDLDIRFSAFEQCLFAVVYVGIAAMTAASL